MLLDLSRLSYVRTGYLCGQLSTQCGKLEKEYKRAQDHLKKRV